MDTNITSKETSFADNTRVAKKIENTIALQNDMEKIYTIGKILITYF